MNETVLPSHVTMPFNLTNPTRSKRPSTRTTGPAGAAMCRRDPRGVDGGIERRFIRVDSPQSSEEREAQRIARRATTLDESERGPRCPCGGDCPRCRTERPRGMSTPTQSGRLPEPVRAQFEPSVGSVASEVRIHTGARAAAISQALHADAFTYGSDIYFNQGRFAPDEPAGHELLAHELAHVSQQRATGTPRLQRRLLLTGTPTDIADFIAMCETASGLVLLRNPLTNEVTAIGSRATPATSATFEAELTTIMDDPAQHAEINVGQDQPNVDIGAFPTPSDLTGATVQNVDMDDIDAMEAGAPGIGVADLLHEIVENYEAHSHVPAAGVDLFPAAHEAGLQAEAGAATDIVGSGRRVAQADDAISATQTRIAEDYDTYYVLSTLTATRATASFTRSNVSFAGKVGVTTQTADRFATGSDVLPAGAAAAVAAVAATLAANPLATVRIEGFTDSVGTPANNRTLGEQRANAAAAALVALGVDGGRIQVEGRGATAFVAPNTTDANRARNRRVVFTVTRPGP